MAKLRNPSFDPSMEAGASNYEYIDAEDPSGMDPGKDPNQPRTDNNPDPGGGPPPPPPAASKSYNPAAGWEQTKLNDPANNDTKYDFGRAAQDFTGWSRGNLQPLVDYYNSTYKGHAKVAGEDQIDFGENYGPVDVINGQTEGLQWLTGGGGQQAPSGPQVASSQYGGGYGTGGGPTPSATPLPTFADLSSMYNGNIANDPMSGIANQSLSDMALTGGTGSNQDLDTFLQDYMKSSKDTTNMRAESARETIDRARKSELANYQGIMADRGLLSEPGIAQGSESSAYGRLEGDLAGQYGTALRDIYANQDQSGLNAAQIAATREQNRNQNALQASQAITSRQQMLSSIALQSLAQNVEWNKFLAQFGLDREKFAYDMQHGNIDQYQQLISLFLQSAGTSAAGFF